MSLRIFALSKYLFRSQAWSLSGLLYNLLAFAFYIVFFDPRQQTPDLDYFTLVIGLFGAVLSFLITLSMAARSNRAVHFPFLVRLPSRSEYLTAVLLSALLFATIIQSLLALLAIVANGPDASIGQLLEIPPLWIAVDVLFASLALHATDLVAAGWSRVYIFGILGVLLYIQSGIGTLTNWLSELLNGFGSTLLNAGLNPLAEVAFSLGGWLSDTGATILERIAGALFWPIDAIAEAVINGYFTPFQALAPALLLLYATILFMLAADFFTTKDLFLTE